MIEPSSGQVCLSLFTTEGTVLGIYLSYRLSHVGESHSPEQKYHIRTTNKVKDDNLPSQPLPHKRVFLEIPQGTSPVSRKYKCRKGNADLNIS